MARKILLADDSVTAQNMGRKILADAGYEVTTVNNGSAALKKIGEHRPDLIVLDVYMPGYSGLEVCQRLKEVGDTSRIPVLLTVGKLEPFKPEEARRVRADGFIVKPFEASELLSALSKLEDKIVPRPETSKPGRLARATAAIEEAHHAGEEDSGWKSRIRFPSKRQKAAEPEPDDPAIYNPINKDLRTVVENKNENAVPEVKQEANPQEERVDLGALAPEGVPKDVTPEEIAALAAAAAQMQGKVLEVKATEQEPPVAVPVEEKTEHAETKAAEEAPTATFAEQAPPEKAEAAPAVETTSQETAPVPEVDHEAAVPAAADSQQESDKAKDAHSGNGSWSQASVEPPADMPVTIAVAAGADSGGSRWTAVAVALAPEDDGISLEQEMHKAYAAFAAAEDDHAAFASAIPASGSQSEAVFSSPVETAASESASAVPEVAHTISEVASTATEAVSAAAKEFETVAASYIVEQESVPAYASAAPVESPSSESSPIIEKAIEAATVASTVADESGETPAEPQPVTVQELKHQDHKDQDVKADDPESQPPIVEVPEAKEITEPVEQVATELVSSDSAATLPVEATTATAGAKKESDIAATTAAAWASWRRIRESSDSNAGHPAEPSQSDSTSQDAAMAVAAGAESNPEEAGADGSDPAIASIVDSVLADLRPKIVEEISRKLGKKK